MTHKSGNLLTLAAAAVLGSASAMAAPAVVPPRPIVPPVRPPVVGGVLVPGYGPGVAGNITIGPTMPVCSVGESCSRPFANALVQITAIGGDFAGSVVATAMTNDRGNFMVSVPPGTYTVHADWALPHIQVLIGGCRDARVKVNHQTFALVAIACDTGIR